MTGRELMIFILENHLEDVELLRDEQTIVDILDLVTVDKKAAECGVGPVTVETWIRTGCMSGIEINGVKYVPAGAERPRFDNAKINSSSHSCIINPSNS